MGEWTTESTRWITPRVIRELGYWSDTPEQHWFRTIRMWGNRDPRWHWEHRLQTRSPVDPGLPVWTHIDTRPSAVITLEPFRPAIPLRSAAERFREPGTSASPTPLPLPAVFLLMEQWVRFLHRLHAYGFILGRLHPDWIEIDPIAEHVRFIAPMVVHPAGHVCTACPLAEGESGAIWTAPERDPHTWTSATDVYLTGILMIACLTQFPDEPVHTAALEHALRQATRRLERYRCATWVPWLTACVHPDPERRPPIIVLFRWIQRFLFQFSICERLVWVPLRVRAASVPEAHEVPATLHLAWRYLRHEWHLRPPVIASPTQSPLRTPVSAAQKGPPVVARTTAQGRKRKGIRKRWTLRWRSRRDSNPQPSA